METRLSYFAVIILLLWLEDNMYWILPSSLFPDFESAASHWRHTGYAFIFIIITYRRTSGVTGVIDLENKRKTVARRVSYLKRVVIEIQWKEPYVKKKFLNIKISTSLWKKNDSERIKIYYCHEVISVCDTCVYGRVQYYNNAIGVETVQYHYCVYLL